MLEIKRHHLVDPSTAGIGPGVNPLLFPLLEISNGLDGAHTLGSHVNHSHVVKL